ncbi:MAG: glucosaminidase domain-containing protein [Zetaproteobacteria bacterium]|nr:glucosaminidase domain-containing protein [Zetaproteobacteria bacterium]
MVRLALSLGAVLLICSACLPDALDKRHVVKVENVHALAKKDGSKSQKKAAKVDGVERNSLVPDFNAIDDISGRKEAFFAWLAPYVQEENRRLIALRKQVKLVNVKKMTEQDNLLFASLKKEYDLEVDDLNDLKNALLLRVNMIPMRLALVQAANESAWGTSRFARNGNNLFGQWCYEQGCGMVPLRREKGAHHEVAKFDSPASSVQSYIHNLNTGDAYEKLRRIRYAMQRRGMKIDAEVLVAGMEDYSERGVDYIQGLRALMRENEQFLVAYANR